MHERPAESLAREALTPIDGRPRSAFANVRERVVAQDALVSIDDSRYSVPAHLADTTVAVHEHGTDSTVWQRDTLVAVNAGQGRQQIVMVPAHYAGLLSVDRTTLVATTPQHDPRYVTSGEVAICDLSVYEQLRCVV
jgi:hypothetical protein